MQSAKCGTEKTKNVKKEVRVKETEEATEDQTLRFYLFNSSYSVSTQSLKVTS